MLTTATREIEDQERRQQLQDRVRAVAESTPSYDAIDWAQSQCRQIARTTGRDVASLFFSEQIDDIRRAKDICQQCELADACFAIALANGEPFGVWGGELFVNGKPLAVKRPRGRPPKDPALRQSA